MSVVYEPGPGLPSLPAWFTNLFEVVPKTVVLAVVGLGGCLSEEGVWDTQGSARKSSNTRQQVKNGLVVFLFRRSPILERIDRWILVVHELDLTHDDC